MLKLIRAQEAAIAALRFLFTHQNIKKLSRSTLYDELVIEVIDSVISINVMTGDINLGYVTYILEDNKVLEVDSSKLEGLDMDFMPSIVLDMHKELIKFNSKLICKLSVMRVNEFKGSIELVIDGFGIVYMQYDSQVKRNKRTVVITRISSAWNGNVKIRNSFQKS